jgi:HPt (histidine-containing phosphotransfer) domain-containing protein
MSDLGATMDALAQRFLARCAEDLPKLQRYSTRSGDGLADVRFIVHRMAGSAGLFGYSAIGGLAARADEELSAACSIEMPTLRALTDALEALLAARSQPHPTNQP